RRAAEQCLRRGDLEGVRQACGRMLERAPRHADAHFLLGVAAVESGRPARGLDSIVQALSIEPARAEYHAQRARCLALLRRDGDARDAATRALALEPRDALTFDTAGVVLARVGAHELAASAFRRAASLAPQRA